MKTTLRIALANEFQVALAELRVALVDARQAKGIGLPCGSFAAPSLRPAAGHRDDHDAGRGFGP